MKTITYEYLQANGKKLESAFNGTCFLYELNGVKYVVLQDNSVITQEEDNQMNPVFPIVGIRE